MELAKTLRLSVTTTHLMASPTVIVTLVLVFRALANCLRGYVPTPAYVHKFNSVAITLDGLR